MPGSSTLRHRPRPAILGSLGRACFRHRRLTLLTWIVGVACLITLWTRFGAPAQDDFAGSDPGQTLLNQHFHPRSGDSLTLAIHSNAPIGSPAVRARVTSALTPFARAAHVTSVTSPYQASGQISADGHVAFAVIQFGVPSTSISNGEALALMHDATSMSGRGVNFYLGGDVVNLAETPYGGPTEGVGVLAAAIVLLIAFGSLLAMGLPVLTAVLGIGAGLSLIALLGHVFPAPSFFPIVASMIGLGVGVDYALFVVTRFREALHQGQEPEKAVVTAMSTAGRTVMIAGTTVIIGMLGLLVLRQSLLNGVAIAAAATVGMVLLGSLTLLPALLGFTGTRLAKPSRLRLPRWRGGRPASAPAGRCRRPAAERWAGVIQRRPLLAALLCRGADPAPRHAGAQHEAEHADESTQARGTMGYSSYATMARGFRAGFRRSAGRGGGAALTASTTRLVHAIAGTPGVARVGPELGQPRRPGGTHDRLPEHGRAGRGHQRPGQPDAHLRHPARHSGDRDPGLPHRAETPAT